MKTTHMGRGELSVSYETNVLAIDVEADLEESFGYLPLNFIVESGLLHSEARGENEVLLIDGSLTVSF